MRPSSLLIFSLSLLVMTGAETPGHCDDLPPRTFLIVVDISGSMQASLPPVRSELSRRSKLEEVKDRLTQLTMHLPDNCRTVVTTFDRSATQLCDIQLRSEAERQQLRKTFASIRSTGGTTWLWRTADAQLELAARIAKAQPDSRVRMLLYTDGDDMEENPGLNHEFIVRKHGEVLKSFVEVDWVTLGYDVAAPVKRQLEAHGVRFSKALKPTEIVPVTAGMILSSRTVLAGEILTLTDNSLGLNIVERNVDWGDGMTDSDSPFQHTFLRPGRFTVSYTIRSEDGRHDTVEQTVEVRLPAAPVAQMELSQARITLGQSVTLSDRTTSASDRRWTAGMEMVSELAELRWKPESPGRYRVRLTVHDDFGQSDSTEQVVDVLPPPPPKADFRINQEKILPGDTVVLTSKVSPKPVECLWTVGDRQLKGTSVTWTATEPGEFPVSLAITDSYGQSSSTKRNLTVIYPDGPTAKFRVSKAVLKPGDVVTLINESSLSATDYRWVIGDQKLSDRHPAWTVPEQYGDVQVSLTVSDAFGQADTVSKTLTILRPQKPVAHFRVAGQVQPGTVIHLLDESTGVISGPPVWFVNDQPAGRGRSVDVVAKVSGPVSIRLVVDGPGGEATCERLVTVLPYPKPQAGFTIGNPRPATGDQLIVTDTSSGLIDHVQFQIVDRDQVIETLQDGKRLQQTFTIDCEEPGPICIRQAVTGPGGVVSAERSVIVASQYHAPRAAFHVLEFDEPGPVVVRIQNVCSGNVAGMEFDPGDGSPIRRLDGTETVIEHKYAPGTAAPVIRVLGYEGLPASTWTPDEPLVIRRPWPNWVRGLLWQVPLGLVTLVGLVIYRRRKTHARLLQQSLLLGGNLSVRHVDTPLEIQNTGFDGVSETETVTLADGVALHLASAADEWGEVVYTASLVVNDSEVSRTELSDNVETGLGDYLVTYAA